MKTRQSLYAVLLAMSATLMSPADAWALDVKVLSINTGTESGNMKAEIIDAGGRTVTAVTGRTYNMANAQSTTRNVFRIFGDQNQFISAEVDAMSATDNNYFYQLEVTFDDGSVVKTDCFNSAMTEGAVWLTDIDRSDITFSNTNYVIGYDECPNGDNGTSTPIQIHPNSTFPKGISFKSTTNPGDVLMTYKTDKRNQYKVPFTYTKFTIGYQAYKSDGSASKGFGRLEFKLNGGGTGSQGNMKSYSRSDRGSATYYFDQIQTNANGILSVGFRVLNYNTGGSANVDGWGDNYANLAACRLYYPVPAHTKREQTVTFDTPGGEIFSEVEIGAFTTGGTPIAFSIIEGKDLATIEMRPNPHTREEEYFLVPKIGKKGTVVVEAITMGDEAFDVASATQSYSFNLASSAEYLYTHKSAADPADQTVYLFVRSEGNAVLEKLNVDFYDNVRSFNKIKSLDLTGGRLAQYATPLEDVYAIPVTLPGGGNMVHSITYKFSGANEVTSGLCEDHDRFVYLSDLPDIVTSFDLGYRPDEAFDGGTLSNSKYEYAKGYGVHAPGFIETPASLYLAKYTRFCVDMGGQSVANAPETSGRVGYQLYNGLSQPYLNTGATAWSNVFEWDFTIRANEPGQTIRLEFTDGNDGADGDMVCVGAPRFYYPTEENRRTQSIEWITYESVNPQAISSIPLEAQTSSGLPVIYRIARGGEFAKIVNNSILEVDLDAYNSYGSEVAVLVEAIQPGNKEYRSARTVSCTYNLCRTLVIQKGERIVLDPSEEVNDLVIYADGQSSGEAVVSSGVVNVKRLVLKYTFTPGKWHHIAFPSDMNLLRVSDLEKKGFKYEELSQNKKPGTFFMREYNSNLRAEWNKEGDASSDEDNNPWSSLTKPEVKAHKGYIMKLETDNDKPVEITFEMQNVALDFENSVRGLYLYVDMSEAMPTARHTVYVRPKNVDGNTLQVDLRYVPTDMSEMPVNHQYALSEMRVTRTPVRGKIRLMLPEQSPCRVGIYDKKGKKLLKAVNYVAPMQIDISDLKPDQYLLTVTYGPAYREMLIDL